MLRSPATIAVMRVSGTWNAWASLYVVMPIGDRNSSTRISPGCGYGTWRVIETPFLSVRCNSVVIDNLNVGGACLSPHEANAPLIIDADAVLADAVTCQCFKTV